ncbi:ankyrin [Melanomma pulvis-pyrius CBS 109.77]|uniref:Ankyrin n=1 Tax=Melanomma pulvis-pyrius CBS 109.77 TaxID=1314802 RepID=A0A6A6XS18_9PLEO|nr:ankyrin [Melanomma pulvis-pyrius CBS 109.77]
MADTAYSITATEPERPADVASQDDALSRDRPFDILAFLALYFGRMQNIAKDVHQQMLAGLFLDDRLLSLATGGGSGGSFSVSIIKSENIMKLQMAKHRFDFAQVLPESIALRVAKLQGSPELRQNQKMLTSMAKEISILTNEEVRKCDNVVKLIGACWSYSDPERTVLLPVLVYEAAPLGDLDAFLLSHPTLPLGHQLQICIDIAQGVERLHRVGAVHCDLKPKNIIMFPTGDPLRPYRAKIADFGCAILLDDLDSATCPPPGTRFWNPPEQLTSELVAKDELHRIDVFSLGLVVLAILTSNQSTKTWEYLRNETNNGPPTRNQHMGMDYFKRWGSLAMSSILILERYANLTVTERSSVKDRNEPYLSPQFLDDETLLPYSQKWNEQAVSIIFQSLQGDIASRSITAREIASVLEGINVSVEINGQRDHVRVDLHEVINSSSTQVRLSYILENESQNVMARARPVLIQDSSQGLVAMNPNFFGGFSTHTNWEYALPRLQAGLVEDGWDYALFGPPTSGNRKWLAVLKNVGEVLTNYLGNMSLMPAPLLNYVMRTLDEVSSDLREPMTRRLTAAYELALGLVAFSIDESKDSNDNDKVTRVLQLLDFAAKNGDDESQWTVGWMYATFHQQFLGDDRDWLVNGMMVGSRIATRRLRQLDSQRYHETRIVIQTEYQGIGYGWKVQPEMIQDNPVYKGRPVPVNMQIVLAASVGRKVKVEALLDAGVDIDSLDGMRETPLIAACRAGHAELVEFLLNSGADPAILSKENISPLHFLSSFDDDEIPRIAQLIVDLGCPLEAHSTGRSNLNTGYTGADRFYGLCDGTPLLWAVAADNIVAVKTLLGLGADPFDMLGTSKALPHSPVLWAAQMHQADVLEALLDSTSLDLPFLLNNCHRVSNIAGSIKNLPLAAAVSYSGGLVFYRIQLHGPLHRENCKKTIHLLLSKGADPTNVNSEGQSAFHYTGTSSQPYALQALLEWHGGSFVPSIQIWTEMLIRAVVKDCRSIFDELLKMKPLVATNEEYSWPMIIAELAGHDDARSYMNAIITHHQNEASTVADYSLAFEKALITGNLENAKIIFNRADKCDIVARRYEPSMESTMTLLGRLMRSAIIYPYTLPRVQIFLELTGGRESLFNEVWNNEAGPFNALQVAVGYTPHGKTKTITTALLELILTYFKHPVHHLNKTHEKNRSLLHMAVRYGNAQAIEVLLKYPGLDWSHRDSEGGTAFDRALNRLQDSWRDKELTYWEVPEEELEQARTDWDNHTRAIIHIMVEKKVSLHSTYSHCFKRLDEDTIRRWMVFPDDGRLEVMNFSVKTFEKGELLDKCVALPVGRCFYLAAYADPEVTKNMPGQTPLDMSELLKSLEIDT